MRNKEKIIGSVAFLIILLVFLIFGYINSNKVSKNNDIFVETTKENTENNVNKKENVSNKIIKVQILGAVKSPGVYSLNSGNRVEDLIKMAGGFTDQADIEKVTNEAKLLKDEESIVIPKKIETNIMDSKTLPGTDKQVIQQQSIAEAEVKININSASKEELMKIPGVGEVIAGNIIDYREKNGGFTAIEDIKKVGRVGEKLFNKIKDKIVID